MQIYLKYFRLLIKAQLQYRFAFWMLVAVQFLVPLSLFAGIYLMFERFGSIKGWRLEEVGLCFGIISVAYHSCECFLRGFDTFSIMIVNGDFDRFLVRPRSILLQVIASQFAFPKLGRLVMGIGVLIWAVDRVAIEWDGFKVVTLILMLSSGILVFAGIFILSATISFWTVQALEVVNIFTWGGREIAQYPLGIYPKWVKRFFTLVIPFGCVNYLPLMFLLGKVKGDELIYMLTPFYGTLFFIPCLILWRFGMRHYRSTGS